MAEHRIWPLSLLRKVFHLDRETGSLVWRHRDADTFEETERRDREWTAASWNGRFAGKPALTHRKRGYFVGDLNGQFIMAHRVVWALVNGEWPTGQIDHINGNPGDNRPINLRVVDHSGNMRNKRLYRNGSSGVTGVTWHRVNRKWIATIFSAGERTYLGSFDRKEDAIAARRAAASKRGFHDNHGRLA